MQNNPVFSKKIYVPASSRQVTKKIAAPSEVPIELALEHAGRVFRSVAWDGAAVVDVELPAPSQPLDMLASARVAFAQIAWTGEVRRAPTAAQSARSVNRVLGSFKWE
jgi:hypothetical protein